MSTESLRIGRGDGKRKRRMLKDSTVAAMFTWPMFVVLICFNIFPMFYSLYLAFTDYSAINPRPPVWVGLKNFREVLFSKEVFGYFATTGRYALVAVLLQTLIGFGLAMLVHGKFKGSGLITTLILIPMMLSPAVVGMNWKLFYNPIYGPFNYLLGYGAGVGPDWLAGRQTALFAVALVDTWMWSPFVMLLTLSGLKAIPEYLYEAAAIDRASPWFQFWRITLPQVAPLLLLAVLFRSIEAFKQFDIVMTLTAGGPADATEFISVYIYRIAFMGVFQTGKAAALSWIVTIVIQSVARVYLTMLGRIRGGIE
jgi:multiple sugar transport system permease protein